MVAAWSEPPDAGSGSRGLLSRPARGLSRYQRYQRARDLARYTGQMVGGARARAERAIAARREADIAPLISVSPPLRVLDLANGRLRPQHALLQAEGHHVYGIDLVNRPRVSVTAAAYWIARGLYRATVGVPLLSLTRSALLCGEVGQLPFREASFDLVTSVAAFEHFLDVPGVVAELRRVLRPGGVAWVSIHPFTCPTGGHNLSATEFPVRTLPPGVEPWDHLRRRRLPLTVPLNEWRPGQYLAEFARQLEVVTHYCSMREGEPWLTPALEAELRPLTRDDLTCAAYTIVARKR